MPHIQKRDTTKGTTYQARYRDPTGRERAKNFTRKIDAERHLTTVEAAKNRGDWTDPNAGRRHLGDWITEVEASKRNRRPSTVARDESVIRSLILPHLGDHPLRSIGPTDIDKWITGLQAAGYAPATIHKAHHLLSRALSKAVTARLIPRTPVEGITLPKTESTEKRFLTADEIALLAGTIGPECRTLVLTAGFTGLRFGELAALRIQNLNLLRRTLRVDHTLSEVNGAVSFGPPKTQAARRTISIPTFLVDDLAAHIGHHPGRDGLVFPATEGGPLRRSNFRRRHWLPAVRASVGEPCRFHDLRHSHVALLIKAGQHPKVIAARLGHKSVRTVLDVYGHLFEGLDEAAADALDAAWTERAADSTRTQAG